MRHSVARSLSVVLFFVFIASVSLFGEGQKSKKRSSNQAAPEASILKADEGPGVKVTAPIKKERRTPSGAPAGAFQQSGSTPVETPAFRVMSHPREDRLVR